MADRTSAEIFGKLFKELAKPGDLDRRKLARLLWKERGNYDFSEYQMDADKALITLGFAEKCRCGGVVYDGDRRYHTEPECKGYDRG